MVALAVLTWSAGGCVAASAESAPVGLGKIAAYQGTWNTKIVYHKTLFSKPRTEAAIVRNDCWRSTDFYACHQFVAGRSAALVVYTYDAGRDVYHTHAIVAGDAPASGGTLEIVGNRWTYPWRDRDARGKPVYLRIVNVFRNSRTIDFRQEFSYDDAHWTRSADGVELRQG